MTTPKKYKIYALDNYRKSDNFVKHGFKEYEIDDLVEELENDECYHMRIHPSDDYIFFGDCDEFRSDPEKNAEDSFKMFAQLLIDFLKNSYNISIVHTDISWTYNESKKGSFHYSVPKIYASAGKLKEMHSNFFKEHENIFLYKKGKKNQKVIDTTIYSEHWFRYPNQTKEQEPGTEHLIKQGKIIDQIVEHIPINSICVDNKIYKGLVKNKEIKVPKVTKVAKKNVTHDDDETEKEVENMMESIEAEIELAEIAKCSQSPAKKSKSKIIKTKKMFDDPDEQSVDEMSGDHDKDKNIKIQKKITKLVGDTSKPDPQSKNDANNLDKDVKEFSFSDDDIESLMLLLSTKRCDNYEDWLNVGICLHNINRDYLYIWKKWSILSEKYDVETCNQKWKSFNKNTDKKLTVGSLLYWCKEDDCNKYKAFMSERKTKNIINKKFPGVDLKLGHTMMVTKDMSYTDLHNKKCLILGANHSDNKPSMYIERMMQNFILKCKNAECFGKTYPCEHICLTKNEMNVVCGTMNVTINYGPDEQNNSLIDFPKFDIFDDDVLNDLVFDSLTGVNGAMANIIYHIYKDVYTYGEDDCWYKFSSHKWNIVGRQNDLLSDESENKLSEIYNILIGVAEKHGVEKVRIAKLLKIKDSFGDADAKRKIMIVIKERFSVRNNPKKDFVKSLNSNRFLLVFSNGVYDLKSYTFRDGMPSDCMSMSVGYDYIEKHSDNFNGLQQFLSDIQPEKEERDFLLTYLSHALYGNMLEWFTIFTGSGGRNGKSKFIELIGKVFGDFYSSTKSQLFTRPQPDANSPDPGLLELGNKKIVISSEPEKNTKLNSGFIKFITGRDTVKLRMCHGNEMIVFSPKFITIFVCNDIPETDDFDAAFSKRVKCVNFPVEFCDNPEGEYQKKIDETINEKFDSWKGDFMLVLIEYYKKYFETRTIVMTDNIAKWTNQYKEDTDIYLKFLNECTENGNTDMKTIDIYEVFSNWFETADIDSVLPTQKAFSTNLKKYKTFIKKKFLKNENATSGFKNISIKKDFLVHKDEDEILVGDESRRMKNIFVKKKIHVS
jgi:P4 family phage/plasmid primase-like protien